MIDTYSIAGEARARQASNGRRALVMLAVVGVALYVAVAVATDATKLTRALRQLGWIGCGAVLTLSCANYLLRFYRWKVYLQEFGHRLPQGRHLLCYVSGFAFTVSPGKAGEAVRSFYLHEQGVTYSESIATLFVERLVDLLAMVILASLVTVFNASYIWLLIGTGAAVFALLIAICRPALPNWLDRASGRRAGHRSSKWLAALGSLLRSSGKLLRPRLLVFGTILGLLAWGAEGLGFQLICRGLDLNINTVQATAIYAIAALAGAAAVFLPAGIGGMEAVMTSLLVSRGISISGALIATLLCRLATLWFAVIIGLLAAGILELLGAGRRLGATS
jgi:uncharacterized protein (TIRG00374 family)